MTREPNPYAQQRTYTVTQTMAISVPSVVAEDVLDGEDGGGMSAADSAVLYDLQSDMVELKSDVATLETNVTGLTLQLRAVDDDVSGLDYDVTDLIYSTIPTINTVVAETRAQANSAYNLASQKSQVGWLTTADYTTSKLRVTSGSGLKALQLTTEGQTATVFDLVTQIAGDGDSSSSEATSYPGGLQQTQNKTGADAAGAVIFKPTTSNLYYELGAALRDINGGNAGFRVSSVNGKAVLQTRDSYNATWTDFTGASNEESQSIVLDGITLVNIRGAKTAASSPIISLRATDASDSSDLIYYNLAAPAVARVESDGSSLYYMMRPGDAGIEWSGDGGATWSTFSGGDTVASDITLSGTLKKVNFSGNAYGNSIIAIAGNFNGAGTELYYYALAASAFANVDYPDCQLKVEGSGLLYTTNGGQTWTAVGDNNSSSDAVLTLSGFAGTYKDYDATVLDYKLGLDLDPSTQQAYLIVKNGAAASWQPLTLGSDSSSGSTVSDSAAKLIGYINGESNLVTDLDYQLCLGKDTNSNLPYILVSNTEGNSWTTLIKASDREYLDAIRPITQLISDPYGSPIFAGSSQNTYQLIADNADLFGNRYLKLNESKADQLDTSAGSMSLSNMVWLSANASRLAELLPYIHS